MVRLMSLKRETRESNNNSSLTSQSKMKEIFKQLRRPRNGRLSSLPSSSKPSFSSIEDTSFASIKTGNTVSSRQLEPNVMTFLIDLCPEDVLPKILAFAGPQKTAALSNLNRVWRNVIAEDQIWQVLCEDLYKWTPKQATPVSWKDFYMRNPVVPTDYPSIQAALTALSSGPKKKLRQERKVRILVRPGRYDVPHAMTIHATRRSVQVTVQGMRLPETCTANSFKANLDFSDRNSGRVTLVSKTRLRNDPLFFVIRGRLVLKNLNLEHTSTGYVIGGGNSAVFVRPDAVDSILQLPKSVPKASAVLNSVEIVSSTGRGVVALNAGYVHMKDSYIHDCAASGVFVGGHGSRVVLETCDVTDNGMGNEHLGYIGGSIVHGHSGICIEQGVVSLTDCNVSLNSASGIYIISPDLTELTLMRTDLLSNFSDPIQLQQVGNRDQIAIGKDCKLAGIGPDYWTSPRSSILVAEREDLELEAQLADL